MAIDSVPTPQKFKGLSTDTKPTDNVPALSVFIETDTGSVFEYSGTSWNQTSTGGARHVTDPNIIYLIDNTTTAGYTYFGSAPSGTATSAAAWVMSKMTNATGDTYPVTGGALAIWDNRATSVTYS